MNHIHKESERESILSKLLPPYNLTVSQLAHQAGISPKTLYHWRKKAQSKGIVMVKQGRKDWSAQQKLSLIIESSGLNAHELSQFCRQRGIYSEQLEQWKQECFEGMSPKKEKSPSLEQKHIKALEKELKRKDKALAETAALLVLQKKLQTLWEDEDV